MRVILNDTTNDIIEIIIKNVHKNFIHIIDLSEERQPLEYSQDGNLKCEDKPKEQDYI
jgi:tRNA G26 N,N-dimethylase Trm1